MLPFFKPPINEYLNFDNIDEVSERRKYFKLYINIKNGTDILEDDYDLPMDSENFVEPSYLRQGEN